MCRCEGRRACGDFVWQSRELFHAIRNKKFPLFCTHCLPLLFAMLLARSASSYVASPHVTLHFWLVVLPQSTLFVRATFPAAIFTVFTVSWHCSVVRPYSLWLTSLPVLSLLSSFENGRCSMTKAPARRRNDGEAVRILFGRVTLGKSPGGNVTAIDIDTANGRPARCVEETRRLIKDAARYVSRVKDTSLEGAFTVSGYHRHCH